MDTKLREINNLCVEIMNSKQQVRGTVKRVAMVN